MKLEDLYYYAEDSPSGLRWKVDRYTGKDYQVKLVTQHSIAGYKNPSHGYWVVHYKDRQLKAHRVIWEIHNGDIPTQLVIDHADGNKNNNLISNLRCVPFIINSRNRVMSSNNTSGVTGVSFNRKIRNGKNRDFWRAKWQDINGKVVSKYFAVTKYGHEQAFQLACQWREQKIAELNEQGAGYSERHGK